MRYKEILKLSEVVNKPVSTASVDMYKKEAEKYLLEPAFDTIVGHMNGYDIRYFKTNSIIYLGATKDNQLISYLLINPRLYKYPAIDLTWTSEDHRGKGIMKYLVKYWVAHYGPVLSDYEQSDSAQGMWQSLIKNPNGLKIKVYNTSTDEISDLNDPDHPWSQDPWNDNDRNIHMMAEKKSKKKKQKSLLVPLIIEACGKIVQDVNTTVDVGLDEITKQAAKFGNVVSKDGYPPLIQESEELDEIVHTGHEPENGAISGFLAPYMKDIQRNGKPVGKINGFDLLFSKARGGSEFIYGLAGGDSIYAVAVLNMDSCLFPCIAITWVDPSMRGKGVMKSLVKYFLDEFDVILSDSQQSSQARAMWQSLIKNPPPGSEVVIWNNKEHKSAPIGSPKYSWSKDPWNKSYDTHLMLTKK